MKSKKLKLKSIVITLIISILSFGCQTAGGFEKETITYAFDFRPYTAKGFLFTTESYTGQYESIGLFSVKYTPSTKMEEGSESKDDPWKQGLKRQTRVFGELDYEGAIDSLYSFSVNRGANAIMNFKTTEDEVDKWGVITPRITISGFAIKRLNK